MDPMDMETKPQVDRLQCWQSQHLIPISAVSPQTEKKSTENPSAGFGWRNGG